MNSKEYLELKQKLEALSIDFKSLQLELELVVRKLKVKYKISKKDDEPEDIKTSVLLPE